MRRDFLLRPAVHETGQQREQRSIFSQATKMAASCSQKTCGQYSPCSLHQIAMNSIPGESLIVPPKGAQIQAAYIVTEGTPHGYPPNVDGTTQQPVRDPGRPHKTGLETAVLAQFNTASASALGQGEIMEESGLRNDPNHAKDSLLQNLRILWAEKDIEKLQKEIQFVFGALEDPLEWLLDVLEIQGGWKGKGCLAYFLIHGLQLWTREHPTDCQSALKLKKLQARLFLVLAQCHGNLLDPLISIYRLHEADSHFLLGHITHFYYMNQYKEAAILSIKLKLQPYLEVEKVASCIEHVTWEKFRKLCIPLLLQDKMSLVVAYVDGHPDLQEQLLRVLDSWCSPGFQLKDIALQYSDLSNIRPDKLNQRVLNKMIFRFLDKYGLDPAICPNATNQRHMGTLRYLFRQRFVKKVMSEENWADHIQSIVQDNQWLQEHLVKLLVHYCSLDAAATWALQYNLPDDRLPCRVVDAMKVLRLQERETVPEQRADGWEDRKKDAFYQLPIPREKIFFLTTEEEVLKCQEELVQPGQVVGIDMEWRPSFSTVAGKPRISVVQLAIQGQVFLLDIMHLLKQRGLEEEKAEAVLVGFFCSLFANRAVVKLGYGMSGDLHSLMATSAAFRDVGKRLCGFVDLLTIHQQLSTCPGEGKKGCQADALQPKDGRQRSRLQERGLSLLVRHILGKPLDKTEQMSNWEKRPLREEQILYAASDAYCLLEVYAKLQEDLASLEWNPSSTGIPPGKASTSTKAKRSPSQQAALSTPTEDPSPGMEEIPDSSVAIAVQDFHVVCDNMLKGLGRYLRCIGVDVQILENDDEHRKAAEIARQEKRVILTSGLPYQMLQSQVGEGRCFQVKCSEKAKEQALQVLKHFNVHVTLADIFSRCQVCNSDRYLKISKETMVQLMKQKGCLTEEDGAGGFSEDPAEETESKPLGSTQPVYSPNCQWLEESDLDIESVTLPGGTPVRVEAVPLGVLSKEGLTCFYCCGQCGKIYWEGSHFQRVASQLKEVLDLSENSQSFYKRA